jgi:urease accessory protein
VEVPVIFDQCLRSFTNGGTPSEDTLVLPFDQRQRARQLAKLDSGAEIGIRLPRGTVLRGGDYLLSQTGELVRVVAAPERVSTAKSFDPVLVSRAAYHLGNRHVHLEVGEGFVRYIEDHVLDDMVQFLGLDVVHELTPFEPEAGAYDEGPVPEHTHGGNGHGGHGHGGHGHGH